MEIKCKCGSELQLSEVSDDTEIYNCENLNCRGQVIITKGDLTIK